MYNLYPRLPRRAGLRLCVLLGTAIFTFVFLLFFRGRTHIFWPKHLIKTSMIKSLCSRQQNMNNGVVNTSEPTKQSNFYSELAHEAPRPYQIGSLDAQTLKDSNEKRKGNFNKTSSRANISKEFKNSKLKKNNETVDSDVQRKLQIISDYGGDKPGINISDNIVSNKTELDKLEKVCKSLNARRRYLLHNKIVRHFILQKKDPRDNFINLHRYRYVIDSKVCRNGSPQVVLLVHSKFNHFVQRALIRETWASNKTVFGVSIRTVFILGQPSSAELNDEKKKVDKKRNKTLTERRSEVDGVERNMDVEVKVHGDIVMGNFSDSYRNLTIKHIMSLDWVLSHCPSVQYVMKVDDDIIVNIFKIAKDIKNKSLNTKKNVLICNIPQKGRSVARNTKSKWFVTKAEYPFDEYPPWCLGLFVFMTRDVVKKLYGTSRDVRPFWIDDVYVTGLVAWRAGITLTDTPLRSVGKSRKPIKWPKIAKLMFVVPYFKEKKGHTNFWKKLNEMVTRST